jgi:hypothetical protein
LVVGRGRLMGESMKFPPWCPWSISCWISSRILDHRSFLHPWPGYVLQWGGRVPWQCSPQETLKFCNLRFLLQWLIKPKSLVSVSCFPFLCFFLQLEFSNTFSLNISHYLLYFYVSANYLSRINLVTVFCVSIWNLHNAFVPFCLAYNEYFQWPLSFLFIWEKIFFCLCGEFVEA